MKVKIIYFLLFLVILFSPATVLSTIINGGFESSNWSGWIVDIPWGVSEFPPFDRPAGSAEVVSEFNFYDINIGEAARILPASGDYFLSLATGDEWFTGNEPLGSVQITARQSMILNKGDKISGWVSFYNGDYEAQDTGWIVIEDETGDARIKIWEEYSGSSAIPYTSATPWAYWEWIAPSSDMFTVTFGVSTGGDNRFTTQAFHDDLCVTPVPEPPTIKLLGLGLAVLVFISRKNPGGNSKIRGIL